MWRMVRDRVVGRSALSRALCLFAVLHFPACGRIGFEGNTSSDTRIDAGKPGTDSLDARVETQQEGGGKVNSGGADASRPPSGDAGNRDAAFAPAPEAGMSDAAPQVSAGDAAPPIVDAAGSGDGIARCRFDPNCSTGGVGATCNANNGCSVGECCTDAINCAGGMCLISCLAASDCPSDMHCAHGYCFFVCESAADCASGMGCFHMNPPYVCEWG